MSKEEVQEYYSFVHALVISGGEIMREGYISTKVVKTKTAIYDLVTEYDMRIEQHLIQGILQKYPDHKFIGEETAAAEKSIPELTDDPTWIIDPIDGTSNFIKTIPHTCISVGLAINKELVMGIVFNPIANELYTARKGEGAYLNGQRINATNCQELKGAISAYETSLAFVPRIRHKHGKRSYVLATKTMGSRSFGCAALSLCYVARGALDCYCIEDLFPWDMAAGVVIVREAGGFVYHISGSEFDVMNPGIICGSTENLCQEMIALIRDADAMNPLSINFE